MTIMPTNHMARRCSVILFYFFKWPALVFCNDVAERAKSFSFPSVGHRRRLRGFWKVSTFVDIFFFVVGVLHVFGRVHFSFFIYIHIYIYMHSLGSEEGLLLSTIIATTIRKTMHDACVFAVSVYACQSKEGKTLTGVK